MRRLIRWASRFYPYAWRNRYDSEFNAFVEDIEPSWRDLCDVLGRALMMRAGTLIENGSPWWDTRLAGAVIYLRSSLVISVVAHAAILSSIVLVSRVYVVPLPLNGRVFAPSPPPAPPRPTDITDARVFASVDSPYSSAYSSLPLSLSGSQVVAGVGIYFPPLPDMGATDHRRSPMRRVWPGQALERNITRRLIPEYPRGAPARGVVSVFLEYLIGTDGSVKVLRALGPSHFADSARLALEGWEYRPVRYRNEVIEVVSRIEVRFDGQLANPRR